MVEKVKIIAQNPLAVADEEEFEKHSVLHLVKKQEEAEEED